MPGLQKFTSTLLLLLAVQLGALAQELPFVSFTPENGINPLPSASAFSVFQDRLGYIWIGIYSSGVVRYDGIEMTTYNLQDGLLNQRVMNVIEDDAARLWVLTDGGACATEKPLTDYQPGERIRFTDSLDIPLVRASINQVAPNAIAAAENAVWVGTNGLGVVQYTLDGTRVARADTFATTAGDSVNKNVFAIGTRKNEEAWIAVEDQLLIWQPGSKQLTPFPTPGMVVHTLYEDSQGTFYGGADDGRLWRLDETSGELEFIDHPLEQVIYNILEDHEGNLWILSSGDGILKLSGEGHSQQEIITSGNGLISNSVRDIIEDREHNIWISQSGGVSRLHANYKAFRYLSAQTRISNQPLFADPGVNAVETSPKDASQFSLYLATDGGVVSLKDFSETDRITTADGLPTNTVYDVIRDSKNRLWVGHFSGLNCVYNNTNVPTQSLSTSDASFQLFDIPKNNRFFDIGIIGVCNSFDIPRQDANGPKTESLWFNSYNRIAAYIDEQWFLCDAASGIPASIIYSLDMGQDNTLWVGTGEYGLYRSRQPITMALMKSLQRGANMDIRQQLFEPAWQPPADSPQDVHEVVAIGDTLWLASSGGFFVVSAKDMSLLKRIRKPDDQSELNISTMAYDASRNILWAGSNHGLFAIDPKQMEIIRTITREEGLLGNEAIWLESVKIGRDGTIYFGSNNGLTLYQPANDDTVAAVPLLHFRDINYQENLNGSNRFQADYVALSFASEKKIRYRTRMVGYDDDWSESTNEHKIRYTNLRAYFWPVEYRFEVSASADGTGWSETPLVYTFSVTPPFWFRWWAFLIYALCGMLLLMAGRWLAANWRVVFAPRKRYISHYKLGEKLGQGGMGQVFRAVDINNRENVAIKLLNEELLEDPANRHRFRNEGRLLATFNHPNIVKVLEIGETEQQGFIAMEFLGGGTLRRLLKEKHPLPEQTIFSLFRQITAGLGEIHRHQIIHRDLKTDNIMLDDAGNLRIMDFGLSKSNLVTKMTTMGTVIGTLGYVAPEQITGTQIDHRVDIFALGVILYEMLTGQLPFNGENEMALIHAIFNTVPPVPSSIRSDISPHWDAIVTRCIAKQVDARFPSVDVIETTLGEFAHLANAE